ncbi:DUF2779 domain-containing protein [Sulfurovum sp. CS9]|uniref:DUF2779 domain-containing protein n=1 Tax=Sulfurovum sp. CS9 TaxID=3391146 RepID=UPI0039E88FFD
MILSKSNYTKAIQCPKALWLHHYKKQVLTPTDASTIARQENGKAVGALACELFPDGRKVSYDASSMNGMATVTKEWIDEGVKTIYEATFMVDDLLVMVDILKVYEDGVEIVEVKSSTEMKDIYYHDVAFQKYVVESAGYVVKRCSVIHLDSTYVRGEELELEKLFVSVDVSEGFEFSTEEIWVNIEAFRGCLADREQEPDIDIGLHCKKPYECAAKEYCWKVQRGIPEYSVFNIFNLGSKKQVELYEQGIVKIEDIPDDFEMTKKQKAKVDNHKAQKTHIDQAKIDEFLQSLTYPLYHLDFETFQQAIPQWQGISPYMQIPFQYSLHIEQEDGSPEHIEFLAKEGTDPREALAERLVADIPTDVTVLAYNMSFEKGVLKNLADQFPKYQAHLMAIHDNIKDLMLPFQKGYCVTPSMQGSYSIKYVLPALVPEMSDAYTNLNLIHNGGEAMNAFAQMGSMNEAEKTAMRKALLKYCELDTLAMVRVLERLRDL